MKTRHVMPVVSMVLVWAACVVVASDVFVDTFDSGAAPEWGNEVGNWVAQGGVYFAQAPNNSPLTYSSLPFELVDFSIDVDINKVQDGGIWLRSSGNDNGVLLVTGGYGGTSSGLYWHVVQNGSASSPMGSVDHLFIPGVSDIHLRVVVSGNVYSAYVNASSTPATSISTPAFSSGRVALYDFSNQTFDNVMVTGVPEPASLMVCVLIALAYVRRCTRFSLRVLGRP